MKKLYIIPATEIIEIELTEMLCVSTSFGEDADKPANARGVFSDEDDWDTEE